MLFDLILYTILKKGRTSQTVHPIESSMEILQPEGEEMTTNVPITPPRYLLLFISNMLYLRSF